MDMDSRLSTFRRGVELFNQGEFYDAHEVLEDVWRETHGHRKKFLQGLIQVAVGLHHHHTGNLIGARSLLTKGREKLADYSQGYDGIAVAKLCAGIKKWEEALARGEPAPPFPRAEFNAPE